jgi:hypothetical protein
MSQDTQVVDATMSDEELELEITLDGTEDATVISEKLANAEKAKKQLLARARKAEAKLKEVTPVVVPASPVVETTQDNEILDLRLDGYTKEEAKFILNNGGRKVLEDPTHFVTIALNTKREQTKAEAEASKAADTTGMSEVERKYTTEQLQNMTAEELAKILPHAD